MLLAKILCAQILRMVFTQISIIHTNLMFKTLVFLSENLRVKSGL